MNIDYRQVFRAHSHQQAANRGTCRTCAVQDDFGGANVFFHKAQRADYSRKCGNSRTVLVVMEDGNIHDFFQFVFDIVAFGGREIFQINAGKGRLQETHGFNDFCRVFRIQADRHGVDVAKHFEKHRFAFHNGHSRFRANIAQTEDARTVADDSDHVAAAGVFKRKIFIFFNILAGLRYAGRISQT